MAHGRRIRPPTDPVVFTLDGESVEAQRGEPIAAALLASGKRTIARSPKFHRPRGPSCMRGECDGCLARVDGAPNTMTCMTPASEGTSVVSQNRLGPREADLLRMTDWFFPEGMNHHELFAGVPGIQTIMQGFARRVAGLGRLPTEPAAPRPARRRRADVIVVGAGASGMAIASKLARSARDVEVLDDQLTPGGGLSALAPADRVAFVSIRDGFLADVASGRIKLRSRTTAGAIYGHDLLVADETAAEIVEARTLVLACGAHDGALAFEGNDVPGVMSARAAGLLLAWGVLVGDRIAVVVSPGGGPFGESFARAAAELASVEVLHGEPLVVRGSSGVRSVVVRGVDGVERSVAADALLVDAPRSPAYELCQQAGAALDHDPMRGYVVRTSDGLVAEHDAGSVWGVGELCGVDFDARAIEANTSLVAARIARHGAARR